MKSRIQAHHCLEPTTKWIVRMTVLSLSSLSMANKSQSSSIDHPPPMKSMESTQTSVNQMNTPVRKKIT